MTTVSVLAALVACLGTAAFCAFQLARIRERSLRILFPGRREEQGDDPRQFSREEWMSEELVLADRLARRLTTALVASLILATAIAVAATVSDASGGAKPDAEPAGQAQRGGLSAADRAAFRGKITGHREVPERARGRRLCLTRYAERGFGEAELSGRWWTSCRIAQDLPTVTDAKERLALPARFGPVRDTRIKATIPAGTSVTYYEGLIAPQCEHEGDQLPCRGHRYEGGGWQYFFPDPARVAAWITVVECTRAREDRPSRWAPCAG